MLLLTLLPIPTFIILILSVGGLMRWTSDDGQGMVEYALLISLIALVVIVALSLTAQDIIGLFEHINATLDNAINI